MNIFTDYFTREELIASLANSQYIPGILGAAGLFDTKAMTGTAFGIEELPTNSVSESAEIPRGAPGKVLTLDKRSVETFTAKTYAWQGAVLADEVLNIRGQANPVEVIQTRRDELTAKLRRQADFQREYLRVTTLNTPTNDFGSAPDAAVVAFGASDSAIRTAIHNNIIKPLETALGGIPYTGLDAWCSDTYWVALIESKTIRETYLNTMAAAELRNAPADSFNFGGITWHRYRAGGNIKITDGQAKIVPRGVSGLFMECNAPDDTLSSVGIGGLGQPYYLSAEPMPRDKGWEMNLQMHTVTLCTRPEAVITIDLS